MTTFDRIEQRMPDLMGELAPARIPDYFDDLLRQSAATRQRPAWSSLERWLPMGTIARIEPARQVPWRPIVIATVLLLAIAAAVALYAGTQRTVTLPPAIGPAGNGTILTSPNGDIAALDLATGETRPLLTDDAPDYGPVYAPDGRTFLFERRGSAPGIWVANADGSNARRVFDSTGNEVTSSVWSQSGDRVVIVAQKGSSTLIALADPNGGQPTLLQPAGRFRAAAKPYGRDFLILSLGLETPASNEFWKLDLQDPTNPRSLGASPHALNWISLSPDGSELVYATWEDGLNVGMNLRVLDLDTGEDRLITPTQNDRYGWQTPQFLPDGTTVIADRWTIDGKYQLALVPADGSPGRGIGPVRDSESGGTTWIVSPDGKTVLATYYDNGVSDGKVWQIDVATGEGREIPGSERDDLTWQRVAP
jgi:Tol biopolymer transport system component